jgi:hypothetical protein
MLVQIDSWVSNRHGGDGVCQKAIQLRLACSVMVVG